MMFYRHSLILLLLLLFAASNPAYAADITTEGQDFWFSFAKNAGDETSMSNVEMSITVVASVTTNIEISNEHSGWKQTAVASATSPAIVTIPASECMSTEGEQLEYKGIHLTADQPVSVYLNSSSPTSMDASLLLPAATLGTDYVVQTYEGYKGYPAYAVIVATEDGTAVVITPTVKLSDGKRAGNPFVITMSKGQSYTLLSNDNKALSGTRISASKAIAVLNGNISTQIPSNFSQAGYLMETAYPTHTWGSNFIIPSVQGQKVSLRFIALNDNTDIRMNGAFQTSLPKNEIYAYELWESQTSSYIECSAPVACYMYLMGTAYNATSEGSPSMMWIAPIEQFTTGATFSTMQNPTINHHYISLVAPTSSVHSITLDEEDISAKFSPAQGNGKFSYCRMEIEEGLHSIHSDEGLTGYLYGMGEGVSYAMGIASTAKTVNDGEHILERIEVDLKEKICSGGSYTLGDNTYTEPGNYTAIFRTKDDLHDSIVHVTLNVIEPKTADIYDYMCKGSSIEWDGRIYDEPGNYQYSYTTKEGCDSIVTLHLEESPTVTLNFDTTICAGDIVEWNGELYSEPNTYQQQFKSHYGCDSIVNMTLSFYESKTVELYDTICEGEFYEFAGDMLTVSGDYTDVSPDINGCDSTTILHFTLTPTERTDLYDKFCKGTEYHWDNDVITSAGEYTHVYTSTHGCDSIVTLQLTEVASYPEKVTQTYICAGDSILWNSEYYSKEGQYTLILPTANGCDSIVTLDLHVYPYSEPTDINDTIPLGQTMTIGNNTFNTAGDHTIILQDQYGCDSIINLHLEVNDLKVNRCNIPNLCADDKTLSVELELQDGWYDLLTITFDPAALAAGWKNDTINLYSSTDIDIALPTTGIKVGHFTAEITLWFHKNKVVSIPVSFDVLYPSSIVELIWDDMLAVLNEKENGGSLFTAYQWYVTGVLIEGETRSYMSRHFYSTDVYTVALTDSTGMVALTCPKTIGINTDVKNFSGNAPTIYPTIVKPRQTIFINTDSEADITIIGLDGKQYSSPVTHHTSISAPTQSGIYIVHIQTKSKTTNQKILVTP